MSSYWPYEACYSDAKGAQPGSVDLMKYIMIRFPGTFSMGIYNYRPSSGGGGLSIHSCGRADDIGTPSISLGLEVVRFVNAFAYEFGIFGQIFNRVRYDLKTPGGRYYTGPDPHIDHDHVEQRSWHATNLRFEDYERIAGPAKGGTVPTYRKVQNVPWDTSTNQPKPWAKELIDDAIAAKVVNIEDKFVDDWERPLTYGALWTILDRLKWPAGTRS